MNLVQRIHLTQIIVPGAALDVRRKRLVLKKVQGIVRNIVIVVINQNPGLDARFFESRPHHVEEIPLVLPGHIERHRVAPVQGFVLEGYG